MTYPISLESRRLLGELDGLRTAARALLDLASSGACEEWKAFELRCPSELELRRGTISLSTSELDEMRSKARRFGEILEATRAECPECPMGKGRPGSDDASGLTIARKA
jgi:hypothetical protein